MVCQVLPPYLVCCGVYFLAHSQYEDHPRWVLVPAELAEYFMVEKWHDQAIVGNIVEIEDASYFYMFSKTWVWSVCELFRQHD
jgi:hypothetical protein